MICANPAAIQALTYWRNSTRLGQPIRSTDAQLDHMTAYSTLGQLARCARSPIIRAVASRRLAELGTWRPLDGEILPLERSNHK